MVRKKVEIIERKVDRINDKIDGNDSLDVDSEDFPGSFEETVSEVNKKVAELKRKNRRTTSIQDQKIRQKIIRELYQKIENIEEQLRVGVEKHFHSVQLASTQDSDEYKAMNTLKNFLVEDAGLDNDPLLSLEKDHMIEPLKIDQEVKTGIIKYSPMDASYSLYYPLLAHEIGHLYTWKNENDVLSSFHEEYDKIENELREREQNKPDSERRMTEFYNNWYNRWKHEFAADAFAVQIFGRAYYYTLLYYLLKGRSHEINHHHPARSMRIRAIERHLGIPSSSAAEKFYDIFPEPRDYDFMNQEILIDSIYNAMEDQIEGVNCESSLSELQEKLQSDQEFDENERYKMFEAAWDMFIEERPTREVNNSLKNALLQINTLN